MKNGKSFIILSALVFLFLALEANATTYWVRPTGTMSGCTPSATAPATDAGYKSTVAAGMGCMASGDTLYVRTGTYTESIPWNPPSGSSWSNPTTISSYNSEVVTFEATNNNATWGTVSYIVHNGIKYLGSGYAIGNGAHHIRMTNCEVTNNNAAGQGLQIMEGSEFNEIISCNIHNNGTNTGGGDHGLYVKSGNNLFQGNTVSGNASCGFHFYNGGSYTVSNNRIFKNNVFGNTGPDCGGILISNGSGNKVYNNIVRGNTGPGIQTYSGGDSTQIYNNTIYGNGGAGLLINAGTNSNDLRNNISFQNSGGNISNQGAGTNVPPDNYTSDPFFINAGANNFHLTAGSTGVINRGVTLSAVVDDFDGLSRPQGIAYDIGAYEYALASSTPGVLQLSASSYSVNEGAGTATITVKRTNGSTGIVGATVSTSDGTASSASDYDATSQAVSFADGDVADKTVSIPITDDGTYEGNETVNLTLSAPTGGATLGSLRTAVLTIIDNDTPTPSGIVGLWTFDEASGTAGDTSGSSNTGTLTNGATRDVGISGNALSLDGVDDYVSIADSNSLDVSSSFTIMAWVNPSIAQTTFRSVLSKSGGSNHTYFMFASSESLYCPNSGPIAGFSDGVSQIELCHGVAVPPNTWTLLTAVYNGANLTIYKNAIQVATRSASGSVPNSSGILRIGASQWGEYFSGKIDDVRIYNTALTQGEIQTIYSSVGAGSLAAPTNLIVK